jgi:hypothetical protein
MGHFGRRPIRITWFALVLPALLLNYFGQGALLLGNPAEVGGGQALIPSNVKIGAAGAAIDIPLGHKDDMWSFNEIDTLTVRIGGAPRPNEIVVIVALSDGGRPRPRVAKSGAVPPPEPRGR